MEHLLFWELTIGSKDIYIVCVRLGNNIFAETKQLSTSIDREGHGDWDFPFGSWKSGNKMSVDFGKNTNDKIKMNLSISIGSP